MSIDLEAALRERGGEASRALRRAQRRRISDAQRADMLAWAGWMWVNRGLRPWTVGNYVDDVASFFEWLTDNSIAPAAVTAETIDQWQQHLFVVNRESARTRTLKLTALRMFYFWKRGDDPTRGIRGPKVPKKQPRKYSTKQLQKIFAACDQSTPIGCRDFALLLAIYSTGARRDELATMMLADIELNDRGGRVRFNGKGAKERSVGFGYETAQALRAWLTERDKLQVVDADAVWLQFGSKQKGQRLGIRGIYAIIQRALRKAKVRADDGAMGLHRLRATFATEMYDAGFGMQEIRIMMGHEDIRTTEGYIAISERQMRARMPDNRVLVVTGKRSASVPRWARRPGVMAKLQQEV